jgi:hypothetical protein
VRFDSGNYLISTDWDAHASSLPVASSDFIDTGEERAYFFDSVPFPPRAIWGAALDLSDLGVSDGGTVFTLRIEMTPGPSNDVLGIGSLVEPQDVPALGVRWSAGFAVILMSLSTGLLALRQRRAGAPTAGG